MYVTANDVDIENVSVTFNGITNLTNDMGFACFHAPAFIPDGNNTYEIIATKEGYLSASANITILNRLPQLSITIANTNYDGRHIPPIAIIVSDNYGELVNGATVTIGDKTGITINGQAIFHEFPRAGNYTIIASCQGYSDSKPTTIYIVSSSYPEDICFIVFFFIAIVLIIAIILLVIYLTRRKKQKD